MKKVLITGGMGYIGSVLAELLYEQGYSVIITKRSSSNSIAGFSSKYTVREMDLLDEASISGVCADVDIVIDTATYDERLASKYPKEALLANGYATRALLEDARISGVKKFIYLSTFHVYGKSSGMIDETSSVNPSSDYALTHYVGELYCNQYAKNHGLSTIIVRLTNGFGAPVTREIDKWYLVLNDLCKSAYESKRVVLKTSGIQKRDFIAIRDIVSAIGRLMESDIKCSGKAELFNISSQVSISIRDIAVKVSQVYFQRYGEVVEMCVPDVSEAETRAMDELHVNSNKMAAMGWQPSILVEDEIVKLFELLEKGR